MKTYILIIERGADGHCDAYFPDVPGCTTAGSSLEEVVSNAATALEGHLDGDVAPDARSLAAILADAEICEFLDGTELFAPVLYHAESIASI